MSSKITVNLPPKPVVKETQPGLKVGSFYVDKEGNLVYVSGRDGGGVVQKMDDVEDGMLTVAAINGYSKGYSLLGLLGNIAAYEEVDVEINVKRKGA